MCGGIDLFGFLGRLDDSVSTGESTVRISSEGVSAGESVVQREGLDLGGLDGLDLDLSGLDGVVGQGGREGQRSAVGDGDGGLDVLDNGEGLGVSVSLVDRIGEVASQTVRTDDGAVVSRSTDQDGGLAGGDAQGEDGQLSKRVNISTIALCLQWIRWTYEFHVGAQVWLLRELGCRII